MNVKCGVCAKSLPWRVTILWRSLEGPARPVVETSLVEHYPGYPDDCASLQLRQGPCWRYLPACSMACGKNAQQVLDCAHIVPSDYGREVAAKLRAALPAWANPEDYAEGSF